jgi:hypothetical protein
MNLSSACDPSEPAQAINPYAVTALTETQESRPAPPAFVQRRYVTQMDWADRRRFLKAVGPLRVAAMLTGIGTLVALYGVLSPIRLAWEFNSLGDLRVPTLGRTFISLARTLVMAYACWLQWQLAGAIAKTAGGTDSDMRRWSQIQLSLANTALATVFIAALYFLWAWIVIQWYRP